MNLAKAWVPSVKKRGSCVVSLLLTGLFFVPFAQSDNEDNNNSASLKLRNYYQDRRAVGQSSSYIESTSGRAVNTQDKQRAWGQGLEVNVQSLMLGSEHFGVGMDFSVYGGLKLLGDKVEYGTTINKESAPYYSVMDDQYIADQESYIKLGKICAKGFVGEEGQKLSAILGWHSIERTLTQTYHRLTPTTFQGASIDGELGGLDIYGSWYNQVSRYNHDKMEHLTSPEGGVKGRLEKHQQIDYVYTVGGRYGHESGFGTELAYAESESYLRLYHVNLNYTFDLSDSKALWVEGQFYKGQSNGDKWKRAGRTVGGFDSEADLYNLNAKLTLDMLAIKASYSQVKAHKKSGLGVFDYHLAYEAGADYDDLGYGTKRQLSEFNHNGEKVWQAGFLYAFNSFGAPGLSLGYTYTAGRDIKASSPDYSGSYKESEHNVEVGYDFQQRQLKGLGIRLQYARHNADKELSQIKSEQSGKSDYHNEGGTDLRVFIDYSISVF